MWRALQAIARLEMSQNVAVSEKRNGTALGEAGDHFPVCGPRVSLGSRSPVNRHRRRSSLDKPCDHLGGIDLGVCDAETNLHRQRK